MGDGIERGSLMDFRQLEYFVTLARVGHFTRAAAQLHVGQPALSQAIRRLEGELGAELLVRGSHPLALTSAGETLLPYAQQALEALEGARVQFGIRQGEPSGRLVIGALSTLGPVETVIASFHEQHPEVDIVLREAVTLAIFEQLRTSELDAAFATLVEPLPSELDHQEAFTEGLVLMTAPGWWTGGELHLGDLDDQPFVFPPEGNGVRIIVERALRDAGVEPHLAMETNEIQRQRALVSRGVGVAIVPEQIVTVGDPPVDLVPIADPLSRTVALLWRRDRRHSATARAFLLHARAALAHE
jgi:DNA-binding transcriptional LysR family regulator